ncbi:hypothetical protein [Vibrio alginolyticus]|uniref:hypothetical protein n=1 Tax=Vibrio alginolyticus TaxID=663 RepID=UPI00301DDD12
MKINRLAPLNIVGLQVLIIVIVVYFFTFSYNMPFDYEPVEGYLYPTNTHDNYVYVREANNISRGIENIGFNNNFGIAFIYSSIFEFFGSFGLNLKYDVLSLWVNCFLILACFITYKKIIKLLGLPYYYVFSFFLFSSLIYFAQLINKDIFTIFIILKGVEFAVKGRKKSFFVLALLSVFVRIQLPVFFVMLGFFSFFKTKKYTFWLFFTYTFFALVNGFFAKYQGMFISEETLSDGLSYWVYYLNYNYYVGSFLLNPLRVIQYFYGYLLSFDFIVGDKLDVSRIKDLPQLLLFLYSVPYFVLAFLNYNRSMNDDRLRVLMSCILSFFLVWLLNPSVSPRYLINFLPIITLISFYYGFYYAKK